MNIDEFLSSIKQKPEKRKGPEPESVFGQAMSRKRPMPRAFDTEIAVNVKSATVPAGGGGIIKKSNLSSSNRPVAAAPAVEQAPAPPEAPVTQALEISDEERLKILQMVESGAEADAPILDEPTLKRMISVLEKRIAKNQEMRIKFADQPEKFMDSELELHESIQELHSLATVSELYPLAVQLGLPSTLIALLPHENGDISCAVLDLLQELTDLDTLNENEEATTEFIDNLLEQQALALLVQNLDRLDESESDGVHNTLSIFENLFELRPELCSTVQQNGLLQWLLKRIKARTPFDGNKLYAAELLAILLQDNQENRVALGTMDGIDILLQQLAVYKRTDPASGEEAEYMENLFNCICSALLYGGNRERFVEGEGPQLMNLMLREKKQSRSGALKTLNHAVSGPEGTTNASKLVEILGLRTIFPLFMKTPKKNKRKGLSVREHEEHVISILAALLQHVAGTTRARILSKFEENDFEKVERLAELHFKYFDKVQKLDKGKGKNHTEGEDEDEDEVYLKRLDAGLFTLQLVDYIILEVCIASTRVKERLDKIVGLRKGSTEVIKKIAKEWAEGLGDENRGWKERQLENIQFLIERF